MATDSTEIELLGSGIDAGSALKGAFVQNMYLRSGTWEVRGGFGQLAQLDTTLSQPILPSPASTYGYSEILGQYVFKTDFGAKQILTVARVTAATGNVKVTAFSAQSQSIDGVVLRVYDTQTNGHFEWPLVVHTSQNNTNVVSPLDWHGCYETNLSWNWQSFVHGSSQRTFFCEFLDGVIFGCPELGAWCYRPVASSVPRQMQVDGVNVTDNADGYSEPSACFPLPFGPGLFVEAQGYLNSTSAPPPVDAVPINGRICYAFGRDLFFSDVGNPQGIMQLNVLTINMQTDITAIAEVFGNLLIFGERETWLYRLNTGQFCTNGQLSRLSDAVGCLGPQAKASIGEALAWCDSRGVYTSGGQYDIKTISNDLQQLFSSQMANPLTYYFQTVQAPAFTASGDDHTKFEYEWKDTTTVSMCYEALQDLLLVTVPALNASLCYKDGRWSLWNFDTVVTPFPRFAAVTRNIAIQGLLALDGEIYGIGGLETYTPVDTAQNVVGALNENSPERSFYILQWYRGGAVDRTVELEEDTRLFAGYYSLGTALGTATAYLGKPIRMPLKYTCPAGGIVGTTGNYIWLVPLVLIPSDNPLVYPRPSHFDFIFNFDNTHFRPIVRPDTGFGQALIDSVIEAERIPAKLGFGLTPAGTTAGVAEMQIYNAGVPGAGGNEVRIRFDGPQGIANGGTWSAIVPAPMGLVARRAVTLMWIPFEEFTFAPAQTTMSMGFLFSVAQQLDIRGGNVIPLQVGSWHQSRISNRHQMDDVAQPIDWLYKSAQVSMPRSQFETLTQTKARGLYLDLLTHGKSTNPVISAWIFSLINAVVSSDWKDWAGQLIDFAPAENEESQQSSLRARMTNGAGGYTGRTFGNAATWGDDADKTKGNYLNSDEERDTIAASANVKGESISWMMFGQVQNIAERLVIFSVKAALRKAGGRRRIGR